MIAIITKTQRIQQELEKLYRWQLDNHYIRPSEYAMSAATVGEYAYKLVRSWPFRGKFGNNFERALALYVSLTKEHYRKSGLGDVLTDLPERQLRVTFGTKKGERHFDFKQ